MSKLKVTTISDPDNDNTAITVDSSGNVTFPQNATFSGTVSGITSGASLGTEILYCSFNGTGTVTIDDDRGFSSITDNGTGTFTATFDSAKSNVYYSASYDVQPSNVSYHANCEIINASYVRGKSTWPGCCHEDPARGMFIVIDA